MTFPVETACGVRVCSLRSGLYETLGGFVPPWQGFRFVSDGGEGILESRAMRRNDMHRVCCP